MNSMQVLVRGPAYSGKYTLPRNSPSPLQCHLFRAWASTLPHVYERFSWERWPVIHERNRSCSYRWPVYSAWLAECLKRGQVNATCIRLQDCVYTSIQTGQIAIPFHHFKMVANTESFPASNRTWKIIHAARAGGYAVGGFCV